MRWLLLLMAGCASPDIRSEVAAVNRLLANRGAEVMVPRPADFAPVSVAGPIDADDAARLALVHQPELRAAVAELGGVRGAEVEAGAWPTPTLEAGFSRSLESDDRETDLEVAVEYDLSRLLLAGGRGRAAGAALQAARYDLAGQALEVGTRARQLFWSARATERVLELQVQALRNQQAAWVVADEIRRAGGSDELTFARRRLAVEEARRMVAEAERRSLAALEALRIHLGLSGSVTLRGRLPDPPTTPIAAPTEEQIIERSLDLLAVRSRLETAAAQVDVAAARTWLPRLGIGAHAEREEGRWEAGGHVVFGLPLLDEGEGAEARAEAELEALRHRYVDAAVQLRSAARTAWTDAESLRQQAMHMRDVLLPVHDQVLAESQKAYNAMQIDVFRLLEAQRARLAAGVVYVETLNAFWQAHLMLDTLRAGRRMGGATSRLPTAPTAASAAEDH